MALFARALSQPAPLSLTKKYWSVSHLSIPEHKWLEKLLHDRGIQAEQWSAFLQPELRHLPDPYLLADCEAAVHRVLTALQQKQRIVIYGDYDVDGTASTAILLDFFEDCGYTTDFFIPDRQKEGYGLQHAAVEKLAEHYQLLIAVDCGSSAYHEVDIAKKRGMDVIIIDHHQLQHPYPEAQCLINPHRQDCQYPFKSLCAAGLVFMFIIALRRHLRHSGFYTTRREFDVRRLLDVVALATVADLVPLLGINRTLVACGLHVFKQRARPGLTALAQIAQVALPTIQAQDLAFRLAPRLNARGRLAQANLMIELLRSPDVQHALPLAKQLDRHNQERRQLEKKTIDEALTQLDTQEHDPACLVLGAPHWHPGVVGLVASRLVDRFHCPAIVIGTDGKGSARSIPGVDIVQLLHEAKTQFQRYGGHAAAAGLQIADFSTLATLRTLIQTAMLKLHGPPPYSPVLEIDARIQIDQLNLALVQQLQTLAPFGQHHPEPLLVSEGARIQDIRVVGEQHLQLRIHPHIKAIGFGMGHLAPHIKPHMDIAFHWQIHRYKNQTYGQMHIQDLRLPL